MRRPGGARKKERSTGPSARHKCLTANWLCCTKYSMRTRAVAVIEVLLLSPAALFMAALVLRNLPLQYQLGHSAHQLVMWYAGPGWTLWGPLLALPLTVLLTPLP